MTSLICGNGDETNASAMRIARKGIESSECLGRRRWVIERTLSWLSGHRRLSPRYERDPFVTTSPFSAWPQHCAAHAPDPPHHAGHNSQARHGRQGGITS
jgi:hypothetical protein